MSPLEALYTVLTALVYVVGAGVLSIVTAVFVGLAVLTIRTAIRSSRE